MFTPTIRKTLDIDSSVIPKKYTVETNSSTPIEVTKFNLNSPDSTFVTVKARAEEIGGGNERASFVFTQRIRRLASGATQVDDKVDNHTFRTNPEYDVYIEALNPTEIFTTLEPAPDVGPYAYRFFLKDLLSSPYDVWGASFSVLSPIYPTEFPTEDDLRNTILGNPVPFERTLNGGTTDRIDIGEDNGFFNLGLGYVSRTSFFIANTFDPSLIFKVGDVIHTDGVLQEFIPSEHFASSGPNHALFVKGKSSTNLLWTLTVGKV